VLARYTASTAVPFGLKCSEVTLRAGAGAAGSILLAGAAGKVNIRLSCE